MNLDDKYIYVFIRQNMFADHQMAHVFHLGFLIGNAVDGFRRVKDTLSGHPSVIVCGVSSEQELLRVEGELLGLSLELIKWSDPDSKPAHDDYGVVGLVTEPVTRQFKNKHLGKYKAWSEKKNIHPFAGLQSASTEVALDGQPAPSLHSSGLEEHSVFNGEVPCSNQGASSKS